MENKEEESLADKINRNVYYSPLIPGIFGFGAIAIPNWSQLYALIWGTIMFFLILRVIIGYFKQKHRDYKWHAITGVFTYDITAFFCLVPFWRVLGEPLWLLITLLSLYVICIYLTHYFRYTVSEGIFSAKKTRFGKIYWITAFTLIGLTGGGSYGFSRALQVFQGYNTALIVITACLIPFSFIIIVGFHGLWVRVENPNYDFNSEEDPNEN